MDLEVKVERGLLRDQGAAWRRVSGVALVAITWMVPFTPGPSAAAVPWLASAASVCLLTSLSRWTPSGGLVRSVLAALAIVAWAFVAHGPVQSDVAYLAGGLALIMLGAACGHDATLRDAIATGLLLGAVVNGAAGLLQYTGLAAHAGPWINFAPLGEAYGNLRQPNQFASLCWIGVAVAVWGGSGWSRSSRAVIAIFLAVACAASVSRTGVLQGIMVLALAGLWRGPGRRERLVLCAIAVAAYAVANLVLPLLLEVATGILPGRTMWHRLGEQNGCNGRAVLWSNVLTLIQQHPWLGWGWGELDYAHFMTLYPKPRFCEIMDNAHDLPLHLAVELGVPAAVLICGGALAWWWRRRPWLETDRRQQLAWVVVGVILVHSLLEYPLWYGPFQIAFGVAVGWLLADDEPRAPLVAVRTGALPAAISGLLLLAVGAAAWDYWRVSQVYLPADRRSSAWQQNPLEVAKRSKLFTSHAKFAELTLAPVTRGNAREVAAMARDMLHYSPEPRVIERLIEADTLLGNDRGAVLMLARYRAAFPQAYEAWRGAQGLAGSAVGSPRQD